MASRCQKKKKGCCQKKVRRRRRPQKKGRGKKRLGKKAIAQLRKKYGRLVDNRNFISQFCQCKSNKERAELIGRANSPQLHSLCELTKNIAFGRQPITPRQKAVFCKNKQLVRLIYNKWEKIVNPKTGRVIYKKIPDSVKKEAFVQKGGLPILPILAAVAGPVISKLISYFSGDKK